MKGEAAGWLGQCPLRGPRVIPSPLTGCSHPCKWIEVSEPQQGTEGALGSKSKGPPALLHSEPSDALLTLGCHAGFCVSRPQTIPGTPGSSQLPPCAHAGPSSLLPTPGAPQHISGLFPLSHSVPSCSEEG